MSFTCVLTLLTDRVDSLFTYSFSLEERSNFCYELVYVITVIGICRQGSLVIIVYKNLFLMTCLVKLKAKFN